MTRDTLAAAVADRSGIPADKVKKALKLCEEEILNSLRRGENVNLQGFGCFSAEGTPARTARNPATGETVNVGPGKKYHFRFSRTVKDK